MLRLSWSESALSYLRRNEGKVNSLELAFADYRRSINGIPDAGQFIEVAEDIYIWKIHGHDVRVRQIPDDKRLHMRIQLIRPVETQ